ncbi:FHA domain-containing protein [Ornithinimicrobium sp. INDO-MA30-4]|uniref:FHA domain-containing protein n=1 Tax=Ornithinimicrobium sp. INDO-MA30-4 TaxID=2908651 RepID=UPI002883296F|nr:FHA domain-containing protein [Ornithinimicrobium sp. INDO-MA30-4]
MATRSALLSSLDTPKDSSPRCHRRGWPISVEPRSDSGHLNPPWPESPEAPSRTPALVTVSTGPDAGQARSLKPGQSISIGRDSACGLSLQDPSLSRRHALVRASRGGIEVDDLGSTNGIYLNEVLVVSEAAWKPGQVLRLGANQLQLVPQQRLPLATMATGTGHLEVAIPLRPSPPPSPIELEAPARPTPLTARPMPILSWAIPLVVATGLAAVFRMPMLMLFGLWHRR